MVELPQNLAFNQAQRELAGCINYCLQTLKLPTYQVEQILRSLYQEVAAQASQELAQAQSEYEKAMKAEQQKQEKSEN